MAATLRTRLGRALLLALIPVLLLGFAAAVSGYRDEADDRRALLGLTAQRSAAEARARLESGASILSVVAAETGSIDCAQRFRTVAERLRGYRNLVRYDAAQRVACASSTVREEFTRAIGPAFRALEAGAPVVALEVMDGDDPVLIAASRVESANRVYDGVLVSVIDPMSLRTLVNPRTLPANTLAQVADRAGLFLDEAGRRDYAALLREAPTDGEVHFARVRTARGVRDVAVAPLLGEDLVLLLSAPAQSPLNWARMNLLIGVGVPLLAFAAAFAAVYTATDRLVIRWLAYLERVAAVYAKGRFSVRPTVADDAPAEVRSLADSMGAMADAITARDAALRESLSQKDALLREIHHRVKNNLQVITSLLNLQQRSLKDPAGRAVLADTRQRISALALIYRAMYQSEDLRRVEVRGFLEELVGQLIISDSPRERRIRADVVADELWLDPDKLAPFALFTVEAITNAQKHAFDGRGGSIAVIFRVSGDEATLEIRDDGVGLPASSVQSGVGRTLMNAFARQLRGYTEIETPPEGGVLVRLNFPTEPVLAATLG